LDLNDHGACLVQFNSLAGKKNPPAFPSLSLTSPPTRTHFILSTPATYARDAKICFPVSLYDLTTVNCDLSVLRLYTTVQAKALFLPARAPSSCSSPTSRLPDGHHLPLASSVLGLFGSTGTWSWLHRSLPKLRRRRQA